jgi:FAD/FMN-containing dehydrogenase
VLHAPAMIDTLRQAFSGTLLTDNADMAPFLLDWRKTWRGTAHAVVQPDSVEDVAKIVRWCAAHHMAIVPQGGNTSQSGGSVPQASGDNIVLSLTRLRTIRHVDPVNNTITVDAGCILQQVQEAALAVDRYFPLSLGAEGSCTIGGNLATNAGGTAVLRYGNTRDLCLGLEVVTAQGDIWNGLKSLRKDNSGYDLKDLFIGSEGTLGVITGAVLKLFPNPAAKVVAFMGVDSTQDAMAVFNQFRHTLDTSLTAFELLSNECLQIVLAQFPDLRAPLQKSSPWYLLAEVTDMQSDAAGQQKLQTQLEFAFSAGWLNDAVIASSHAQSDALWALRENISEAQGRNSKVIKHDISVPISSIADFTDQGIAAVGKSFPSARPVIFGHLGDGNLHYNFASLPRADGDIFLAQQPGINQVVHDLVRAHHGSISAEHGLGVLRRDEASQHRSPVEKKLMQSIKQTLDPQNIMNPGKLL